MKAPTISYHEFETHFADLLGEEGAARLRAGDPASVERAIAYLEADSTHTGSGSVRAAFIRQQERLRTVILRAVQARDRREFRAFCRLAAAVQTPALLTALSQFAHSHDLDLRRRAGWMRDYLSGYDQHNRAASRPREREIAEERDPTPER